ncbi:MAG: tyrosine-type recombinase/integrase [Lachnospiraceae bacterium]|nr:tyrosine-type recombinase/integrase [Lachnospiraceae bacterium]
MIRKALGIKKNFTTHDCRRYAATNAALEGMTTPAMQMAFGWKDRETAEKYIQIAAATKEYQKVLVNVLN